jgi:hypothetical protein
MTREMLLSACTMPLPGIVLASLAKVVPIGGGIVFVPILYLGGFELKLGAAFAVATMTLGNGVLGFLSWLKKDLFQPCVRMRDQIVTSVCPSSVRHPPLARFLATHLSILMHAAIPCCDDVAPIVVHLLHRNWNRRCLIHKELNSLWIRPLRFPLCRSPGTTIGATTSQFDIFRNSMLRWCCTNSGTSTSSELESNVPVP